jgi:hypothetical protein
MRLFLDKVCLSLFSAGKEKVSRKYNRSSQTQAHDHGIYQGLKLAHLLVPSSCTAATRPRWRELAAHKKYDQYRRL